MRRTGSPLQLSLCEGPVERARGLLGRAPPQPGTALWIVPCRAVHTWGMAYPIDVAFLDERGLVLQVAPNCAPRRAYADRRAHSALEFRAGECARLHLRAGERLVLPMVKRPPAYFALDTAQRSFVPLAAALAFVVVAWLLSACTAGSASARALRHHESVDSSVVPGATAELKLQADLEYESRAWSRAEAAYRELVHRNPIEVEPWSRLGIALLHLGRHAEAADVFATLESRGEHSRHVLEGLAVARTAQAALALRAASTAGGPGRPLAAAGTPELRDRHGLDVPHDAWSLAAEHLRQMLPPAVPLDPPESALPSEATSALPVASPPTLPATPGETSP